MAARRETAENGSFHEYYHGRTGLTIGRGATLFSEQSDFQHVEVFESDTWGNVMTIDGIVMLSERDEFVYHEMLVHVPLFSHPNPRRVLIIGGGDGGSAREALRHPSVERVDMVEIDETVIRAAKQFLPAVGDFSNPKLHLTVGDGIAFLKSVTEPYDVIIVDGSDPVGPAEGLFNRTFHEDCFKALADDGILTAQTDSPWLPRFSETGVAVFRIHSELFSVAKPYLCFIPLYPTGMFSMAYASKSINPTDADVIARVEAGLKKYSWPLRYYNAEVHRAAFALPNFVKKRLQP
jgi:spermidine synthase